MNTRRENTAKIFAELPPHEQARLRDQYGFESIETVESRLLALIAGDIARWFKDHRRAPRNWDAIRC